MFILLVFIWIQMSFTIHLVDCCYCKVCTYSQKSPPFHLTNIYNEICLKGNEFKGVHSNGHNELCNNKCGIYIRIHILTNYTMEKISDLKIENVELRRGCQTNLPLPLLPSMDGCRISRGRRKVVTCQAGCTTAKECGALVTGRMLPSIEHLLSRTCPKCKSTFKQNYKINKRMNKPNIMQCDIVPLKMIQCFGMCYQRIDIKEGRKISIESGCLHESLILSPIETWAMASHSWELGTMPSYFNIEDFRISGETSRSRFWYFTKPHEFNDNKEFNPSIDVPMIIKQGNKYFQRATIINKKYRICIYCTHIINDTSDSCLKGNFPTTIFFEVLCNSECYIYSITTDIKDIRHTVLMTRGCGEKSLNRIGGISELNSRISHSLHSIFNGINITGANVSEGRNKSEQQEREKVSTCLHDEGNNYIDIYCRMLCAYDRCNKASLETMRPVAKIKRRTSRSVVDNNNEEDNIDLIIEGVSRGKQEKMWHGVLVNQTKDLRIEYLTILKKEYRKAVEEMMEDMHQEYMEELNKKSAFKFNIKDSSPLTKVFLLIGATGTCVYVCAIVYESFKSNNELLKDQSKSFANSDQNKTDTLVITEESEMSKMETNMPVTTVNVKELTSKV